MKVILTRQSGRLKLVAVKHEQCRLYGDGFTRRRDGVKKSTNGRRFIMKPYCSFHFVSLVFFVVNAVLEIAV